MVHFVIDFDGQVYNTLCGIKIAPTTEMNTGIWGQMCHTCEVKVKTAWVTFK